MKQVFVISAVLIQLLGFLSAGAKLPAPTTTEPPTEKHRVSAVPFHQGYPADITHALHFTGHAFNGKEQRTLPGLVGTNDSRKPVAGWECNLFTGYRSPFYLPFTRLLLFPNHYFW